MKELIDPQASRDATGAEDFRDKLKLQITSDYTYVVMLSIDDDDDKNVVRKLAAKRGVPLVPYAYNMVGEYYNVRCVEYMSLGVVPIGFQLVLPGVSLWKVRVPMPVDVLECYFTDEQKTEANNFRTIAKEANLRIEYLQMVSCL